MIMKKTAILLLTLALLLTGCNRDKNASPEPSASAQQDGPQMKTVYIRTGETRITGDSETRTDYLLDDENRVCQVVMYTNGQQTQRYDVQCDENGNYIKWVSEDISSTYTYDQLGRSLGHICYHGDTVTSSVKRIWAGQQLGELIVRNGSQETRTVYTYNDEGHKIREELYQDGVLFSYSQLSVDSDGLVTTQRVYQADGTQSATVSYTYEDKTVTATTTDPEGNVRQRKVEVYDEHNNLLETALYDSDGQLLSKETTTWTPIQVPVSVQRASI